MKNNLTDEQKLFVQSMMVLGDIILDDESENIIIVKLTDEGDEGTFNIVNLNNKSIQRIWVENLKNCNEQVIDYYHKHYKNLSDIEAIDILSNNQIEKRATPASEYYIIL